MKDGEMDDILKLSSDRLPEVDRSLVDNISASIRSSLHPVRPLPSPWIWLAGLIAICAAVAIAGGIALGPHGIQKMSALQIEIIFPVIGLLVCAAALSALAEVIPGRRGPAAPWIVPAAACIALAIIFGLLFSDYATESFISEGMICLRAGLLPALPVALGSALLLRRGFAVNPISAWAAKGTLGGLAGIAMLELHCANFEAPHILVWHIAVIPAAAVIGAAAAWTLRKGAYQRA